MPNVNTILYILTDGKSCHEQPRAARNYKDAPTDWAIVPTNGEFFPRIQWTPLTGKSIGRFQTPHLTWTKLYRLTSKKTTALKKDNAGLQTPQRGTSLQLKPMLSWANIATDGKTNDHSTSLTHRASSSKIYGTDNSTQSRAKIRNGSQKYHRRLL